MTHSTRRSVLGAGLALALGVAGFAHAVFADEYPSKPITMFIGYNAGGQTDLVGRAAAKVMSDQLGVPINVVNKPGAGGVVAVSELAKAAPDGYTIMFHSSSVVDTEPLMMKRVEFTPDDFDYAGMITAFQVGMATYKDAPYDDLDGFVAWAKKNPGFDPGKYRVIVNVTGVDSRRPNVFGFTDVAVRMK